MPTSALVAINLADVGMTTSGLIRLAAVVGSSTSKLTYLDISAPVLFSYQVCAIWCVCERECVCVCVVCL